MPTPTVLDAEVAKVAARIRKAIKGKLNEQNTKASMIEPILRALGWDTEDVEEVAHEYRNRSKDSPVDYGLLSTAGSEARVSVIGARADGSLPATNGWSFWTYRAPDGSEQMIDHARQAYLRSRDVREGVR